MNSNAAKRLAEIDNDGYTIIENVMSEDLMTRIRAELAPYCQGKFRVVTILKAPTQSACMPYSPRLRRLLK